MKVMLLVGHGSRNEKANQQFIQLVNRIQLKYPFKQISYCFLQFANPSLADEVDLLVKKGTKEIDVYPILLTEANHAKVDIQALLKNIHYCKITIQKPLGIKTSLIPLLMTNLTKNGFLDAPNTAIVFVGRGSSDSEAMAQFESVEQVLQQQLRRSIVQSCVLYGGGTNFHDAINRLVASSYEHIYVLPYLLFEGILFETIKHSVYSLNDDRFHLCHPLASDDTII